MQQHTPDDSVLPADAEKPGAVPERLSSVLARLAARPGETIRIGDISRTLRDRGFGALMILLASPNLLPMPPGVSTVFGLPLIYIAIQLVIGYRKPLLPARVRRYELSSETFRRIIARIKPWIVRFERLARPRLWLLPQRLGEQIVGLAIAFLGFVLILPIPLGNFIPGVAIIMMCLGLGERDGVWTGAGLAMAVLSVGVVIGVLATAGVAAISFF